MKKLKRYLYTNQTREQAGISLIEVLLVVGVLVLIGGALVRLGISALQVADTSRMRTTALQIADESLEFARNHRDRSPDNFFDLSTNNNYTIDPSDQKSPLFSIGGNCDPDNFANAANKDQCGITRTISNNNLTFYRVLKLSDLVNGQSLGADQRQVTVYVFWRNSDDSNYSNASSSTILSRWR